MKHDNKNTAPMSTGQATSERGIGDIDASTDVLFDDSLLWVLLYFPIRMCAVSFLLEASLLLALLVSVILLSFSAVMKLI